MKKILLSIVSICIFLTAGTTINAQPDSLWSQTFGGLGNDGGSFLVQTEDDGFLLAGYTWSYGPGMSDLWLIRTDAGGNSLWEQFYGGRSHDIPGDLIQTEDGGFAILGHCVPPEEREADFWLVRTDERGDTLWTRSYGEAQRDWGFDVLELEDGGFILAGVTNSYGAGNGDFWLIRTDENGHRLWDRTYGGELDDFCYDIVQTFDGDFVLAGYTYSSGMGSADFWLIRTDEDGNCIWSQTYGGRGRDLCYSMIQTDNGGFALAGETPSNDAGDTDFWLVVTDGNGDLLWSQTYGGAGNDEWVTSINRTPDGGYSLGGRSNSFGNNDFDFWLVRTDEVGNYIWSKTFGGRGIDNCISSFITSDDGFALLGGTRSFGAGDWDCWLVKTGPDPVYDPPYELNLQKHIITDDFHHARSVFPSDLNSDGHLDVIGAANTGGKLSWWEFDGFENFSEENNILSDHQGCWTIYADDIDGDNYNDILLTLPQEHTILIWWINRDGSFSDSVLIDNWNHAYDISIADMNGNGRNDIIGVSGHANQVAWWENTGDRNFTFHIIDHVFRGGYCIYVEDCDLNGKLDIIGGALADRDFAIWLQDDDGTFEKDVIDDRIWGTTSVTAKNLDNDPEPELLVSAQDDHIIALYDRDNNGNYRGFCRSLSFHRFFNIQIS